MAVAWEPTFAARGGATSWQLMQDPPPHSHSWNDTGLPGEPQHTGDNAPDPRFHCRETKQPSLDRAANVNPNQKYHECMNPRVVPSPLAWPPCSLPDQVMRPQPPIPPPPPCRRLLFSPIPTIPLPSRLYINGLCQVTSVAARRQAEEDLQTRIPRNYTYICNTYNQTHTNLL